GRFDHRDDDGVGAGVEDPSDRCRVGVGQPHRRGDWYVFDSPQHARDVGVVDVAVLGVEADVVVAGPGEFLGPDRGRPGDPATPDGFTPAKCLPQLAFRHGAPVSVIAIFPRSATGRQANSKAPCTSSMPNVWVRYLASRPGCSAANLLASSSMRGRSSATPDFRVRLCRSMVRMLIG